MTVREIYKALLIELDKVSAPNFLLEDFNYYLNKTITQYINKRYNVYDVNQQTTDDLRVLSTTTVLTPTKCTSSSYQALSQYQGFNTLYNTTYEVTLPTDYLHILGCQCIFQLLKNYNCYTKDSYVQYSAKKLTSDSWGQVMNDYYNRPSPTKPYFFIQNINQSSNRMEIRYGQDDSVFKLVEVLIDYIKVPKQVELTEEQLDLIEDTSQELEFPDYVCKEIIHELATLFLEVTINPRLQNYIPVNQSIAPPIQQQTK